MIAKVRHESHYAPARILRAAAGALFCVGFAAVAHGAAADGVASRPAELSAHATNVMSAISARYALATNVSCTVRHAMTVDGNGGPGPAQEAVSRVVWARGGYLNAQKIAPQRRRTVIDGTTVWTAAAGDKDTVSFPVANQLPSQAINLRSVPASPEESLAPLDPSTAEDLAPIAPFARRVAFRFAGTNAPNASAVVSFDADGAVGRLEAFDDDTRSSLAWTTEFAARLEPLPGLFLYRQIVTTSVIDGRKIRAVSSYDRIRLNEQLPPSVFDPKAFF